MNRDRVLAMLRAIGDWLLEVWGKVRDPISEIVGHFVITVVSVLAIAAVELVPTMLHYNDRHVPVVGITLSEWLYDMDVLAATAINAVGIVKGVRVAWNA